MSSGTTCSSEVQSGSELAGAALMALPKVTALPMRPGRQVHTWWRLGRARCFPSASAVRALDRPDQRAGLLGTA